MPAVKKLYPKGISYCEGIDEALVGADICLIFTEWKEIVSYDLKRFSRLMRHPIVLDGRNCYALADARAAGILYDSIGRPCVISVFSDETVSERQVNACIE